MASSDDGRIEIPVNVDVTGAEAIDALRDKVEKLNDKLGELTKATVEGAGAAANTAVNVLKLGSAYDAAAGNLSRFLSTLGSQTGMLTQSVTQLAAVRTELEGIAKATPAATKAVDGAKGRAKAVPAPDTPMQSKINQSLGVGAPVHSAKDSASVFEADFAAKASGAGQAVEDVAGKVEKLESSASKGKGVISGLAGNLLSMVPQHLTETLGETAGKSSMATEAMEALTGAVGVELTPALGIAAAGAAAFYGAFGLLHASLQKGIPPDLTKGMNLTAEQMQRLKEKGTDLTVTFNDTVQATFEVFAQKAQSAFEDAYAPIKPFMDKAVGAISDGLGKAFTFTIGLLGTVFDAYKNIAMAILTFVGPVVAKVASLFGTAIGNAVSAFEQIAATVFNVVKTTIETVLGIALGGFNAITLVWKTFPQILQDAFITGVNVAGQSVADFINKVEGPINSALKALGAFAHVTIPEIPPVKWDNLPNGAAGAMAAVGNIFKVKMTDAKDIVEGAVGAISKNLHDNIAGASAYAGEIQGQEVQDRKDRIAEAAGPSGAGAGGTQPRGLQPQSRSGGNGIRVAPDNDEITPIAAIPSVQPLVDQAIDGQNEISVAVVKSTGTQANAYRQMYTNIGNEMRTTVEGLIKGTESWTQVAQRLQDSFIDKQLRNLQKWLTAHLEANTAKTASDAATAATAKSVTLEAAISQANKNAVLAGQGAYTQTMNAVPPPLNFPLAAASAAAAYAGSMALAVFSARGGWDSVPYDGAVTALHKNEMVLPEKYASPLRDMLGRNGGATTVNNRSVSRRGDDHYHIYTQPGMNPRDVADAILKGRRGNMYDARRFA